MRQLEIENSDLWFRVKKLESLQDGAGQDVALRTELELQRREVQKLLEEMFQISLQKDQKEKECSAYRS